jgi:hypothetical protein
MALGFECHQCCKDLALIAAFSPEFPSPALGPRRPLERENHRQSVGKAKRLVTVTSRQILFLVRVRGIRAARTRCNLAFECGILLRG